MALALRGGAVVLVAGIGLSLGGCQSSESEDWAQTAPLITPVQRPASEASSEELYLGAWAEMTASRADEPRASVDDPDEIRFSN